MTVSDTDVSGVVAAEDGAVPQPAGRAARASFHELTVAAVEQLTDDSAAVTFRPSCGTPTTSRPVSR